MSFKDRSDAGRRLAAAVMGYIDQQPVVRSVGPPGGVTFPLVKMAGHELNDGRMRCFSAHMSSLT